MSEQITALSVIDSIDTNIVARTMDKIQSFQMVIQKAVKPGQDIGIIPGTNKPTLLKPGAEKIVMMMGLSSRYEIMDKVEDYDKGFFAYNVRCILSRQGLDICQGVGHCNSRESKYVKADPYSITNTILKMGKKRAFVDAALSVASLSDVFTQDLEDMPEMVIAGNGSTHRDNQGKALLDQEITFGKFKGRTLGDLLQNERQYLEWLAGSDNARWAPIARQALDTVAEDQKNQKDLASENSAAIAESLSQEEVPGELSEFPPAVLRMAENAGMTVQDLKDYVEGEYGKSFAKLTAAQKSNITKHLHDLGQVGA